MVVKKDIASRGYDCSTVIGLGFLAGSIVLLVTEVPALALLTMGIVKVLGPVAATTLKSAPSEKLFESAIEAIE